MGNFEMDFNAIRYYVNPKTVIDVGANTGWFALNLKQVCPNVDITMIEANPNCEKYLDEVGFSYSIAALSDRARDKVKFYINKDDEICTGASLYKEDTKFYDECLTYEVETYPLDEVELYPEGVDLLKLDVQGSEKDVLMGAQNTLLRTKHLLIECSLYQYNIGAPLVEEIVSYLKEVGFYPKKVLYEHTTRPGIDFCDKLKPNVSVVHQIDILFDRIPDDGQFVSCEDQILTYRKNFDKALL
jgi:FkbM family methyltransferase